MLLVVGTRGNRSARRRNLPGSKMIYANLVPAVSPTADVIVVGLVLLWRLTSLWSYLHFCMEKEKKHCRLIELMALLCMDLRLDLRKAQMLFAIRSLHYSVALKQALSTAPQHPTNRPDVNLIYQQIFQKHLKKFNSALAVVINLTLTPSALSLGNAGSWGRR